MNKQYQSGEGPHIKQAWLLRARINAIPEPQIARARNNDAHLIGLILPIMKGASFDAFTYMDERMDVGWDRFWMLRRVRNSATARLLGVLKHTRV